MRYAYGVDAFQALVMAIEGIRVRLEKSRKKIVWEGTPGYHGFSRYLRYEPGLDPKRLERLIDREVARHYRVMLAGRRKR